LERLPLPVVFKYYCAIVNLLDQFKDFLISLKTDGMLCFGQKKVIKLDYSD